jgi:hypothetical protein
MEIVPQMDILEKERTQRNHEEIIRLLESENRADAFLEIGRLLNDCKNQKHFRAMGYLSFKEYVQSELKSRNLSYDYATRYIGVYALLNMRNGPPRSTLQDIGFGRAYLLLPRAKKGEVSPAQWKEAKTLSFGELWKDLQRDARFGGITSVRGRESPEHRDIQNRIQQIGTSLGRYTQKEYPVHLDSPSKGLLKYDVVWKTHERVLGVTHVFEVCLEGGSIDHDINKLGYTYRTMDLPRLFLVVAEPEDMDLAKSLASGDMAQNLEVLTARRIHQLHNELRSPTIRDFIDLFMK